MSAEGATEGAEAPILVLGCQRSGTTLLRKVLDSHSRIACPPESKFMVQLVRLVEIDQSREGLESMGFDRDEVTERMGRFAAGFFDAYRERKGKARWADKTPHHLMHLDTIDAMFGARTLYLGIVRHGLDVSFSLQSFDWGAVREYRDRGVPDHVAGVQLWRDQNLRLLDFRDRHPERVHLLRYEELTSDPEGVLRQVFGFLGEPWEPAVLRYGEAPHDDGFGDTKTKSFDGIVPNSGSYRAWPEEVRREAYEAAREMFERLGYEP